MGVSYGPPGFQFEVPDPMVVGLVSAPWLLVGGPRTHLLSLILLLITVMCVITEKKLQLNIARLCCHNFLSLVVSGILIAGGPGPLAPTGYAYGYL